MYIVTLREGSMCLQAGLPVEFKGSEAHVSPRNSQERETFWAKRLQFLRENPAQ